MYGSPHTKPSKNIRIYFVSTLQERPSCYFLSSTPSSQRTHSVISLWSENKKPSAFDIPPPLGFHVQLCEYLRDHLLGCLFESHYSRSQKNVGHPINPLSLGPQARKQLKGLALGVAIHLPWPVFCLLLLFSGSPDLDKRCHHHLLDAAENPEDQMPVCVPELFHNFHPHVEWLSLPAFKRQDGNFQQHSFCERN